MGSRKVSLSRWNPTRSAGSVGLAVENRGRALLEREINGAKALKQEHASVFDKSDQVHVSGEI